ncbi:peptidylprolyl isomerase [Brevundimonas subvibrioides]|uniref:peptidylprolyl isomerase n=1 Tax=Brevundimonas subvibrioides (strain ATCC 15264 / DSM 4735 / LMG 14903 / NBRC 16000 / CB 81) TaxID=633149 RepID=D9QFT3_BRESC|nr:peptidylprolyl isomerase [Brevundimonas subvibrioides]ADL00647.1 peptidyl-prolyl cis-trans isomerase cyclophilin type [Brevundimonas subvibrioides ATCC 15264]
MIRLSALALLLLAGASTAQAQEAATLAADAPMAVATDWRTVPAENLLVIDTNRGRILVEMTPEAAPLHVERMRVLARRGFFDGIVFHRVIDGFMAQTGDPLGTGEGQSPYPDLKAEFTFRRAPETPFAEVAAPAGAALGFLNSLPIQTQPTALMATTADGKVHGWGTYCPGVAGMARDEANDSANSQFFLMRQPYPALDKRYTIWGRVVSGLDVVRAIKVGDGENGMVTADPDRMTRVRIASDLPDTERPVIQVMDASSAAFRTLVDGVRTARGADFSICDVDLPVQVSGPAAPAV